MVTMQRLITALFLLVPLSITTTLIAVAVNPISIATIDQSTFKTAKKDWTFIVYIAADNDLRGFAGKNIKQMASIGSNDFLNIVVHLDICITPNNKTTRRYLVEKNKVIQVNANDPHTQCMDSGDPRTLISACKWAIENYPANNYALVLWNHGTGALNPETGRIINPTELFTFNPTINKLELNRSIGFLDFINAVHKRDLDRGICWDDSTGNYLSDQKLDHALHYVTQTFMGGKKFELICFDACLMSMIEVTTIIKNYARIMVSSQEVELGTGWSYDLVLAPFASTTLSAVDFAKNIVVAYHQAYSRITNDFTQSAIDLDRVGLLEANVAHVASLLGACLRKQTNSSVKNALKASRNKQVCTHFDEPSYVDLHHLYCNIYNNLRNFQLEPGADLTLILPLKTTLEEGINLVKQLVFANTAGTNLRLAQGISIYFPDNRLHSSYRKSAFGQASGWLNFINQYLTS